MTAGRMIVTVATSARVRLSADGWFPREVVEKVFASLAVKALCVVSALTLAVHHVRFASRTVLRQAPGRVPVTRTTTPHYHLCDCVVIFFQNLIPVVQQIVSERVKFGEINSQIGHLQQVLYFR